MIKLTKEIIDNSTFLDFINIEKNYINLSLKTQEDLKNDLLYFLKSLSCSIENKELQCIDEKNINDLENIANLLKLSSSNILAIKSLVNRLDELCKNLSLDDDNFKHLEDKLEEYNNLYSNTFSDISVNNNSIQFFINKNKDIFQNNINDEVIEVKEEVKEMNLNLDYPEKTLLISEIDNKVYLPYTNNEITQILNNPILNFKNEQEIVNKYYTVPTSNYKSFSFSRFKEAYKLVREKEKGSLSQAIELGVELFTNYNLHPAIITACKNLNELDVYLSCLEYNELDDFNFFKIEFRATPSAINIKV